MTISQRTVRDRRPQAHVGDLVTSSRHNRCVTMINAAPQAKQVNDVTVDTAADATEYAIVLNGFDIAITSGAGATVTSIAAQLVAAINQDARVRGQVAASAQGADTVRLTGLIPGLPFTLLEVDATPTLPGRSGRRAAPLPCGSRRSGSPGG